MARLRFDKVANRVVASVQDAIGNDVPPGTTVTFTITAPIGLASNTAAALQDKIRALLARRTEGGDTTFTLNGNRIRIRLIDAVSKSTPRVLGFVHNADSDSRLILDVAQLLCGSQPR
jgi:hypothetical protein